MKKNIKEMTLEITQQCLNNCIYCSSCSSKDTTTNTIPFSKIYEIINSAKEIGVKHINLSGGEPFLHPHILNIIELIKKNDFVLNIYSSGLYVSDKIKNITEKDYIPIPEDYITYCKEHNVEKIIFNMQAMDNDTHYKIAGVDCIQNIRDESIKRCNNNDIHTEINIVPIGINYESIENICHKALDLGCQKVNLLGLVMQGRCHSNKDIITMSDKDSMLLKEHILPKLQEVFGKNVRIGSPLSGDSSAKCYAGFGRISIRYDGLVFPCEAWKHKYEFNGAKPLSIYKYPLEYIVNHSEYLNNIVDYVTSLKCANCADCPAQKELGFDCALDKSKPTEIPEYLSIPTQDSHLILENYINGILENNIKDLYIQYLNSSVITDDFKSKYIGLNYLSSNLQMFDIVQNVHVLATKSDNSIKGFTPDPINISNEVFNNLCNGRLSNMRDMEFSNDVNPNVFLFNEPYVDKMVSEETRINFYKKWLEYATYPIKDYNKKSIAISISDYYSEALLDIGFKEVYSSDLFRVFVYITPKQMSTENILNLNMED